MTVRGNDFKGLSIKLILLRLIGIALITICIISNLISGISIRSGLRSSRNEKLISVSEKDMKLVDQMLQDKILMLEGVARKEIFSQFTYDSDEIREMLIEESQKLGFIDIHMANTKGILQFDEYNENISTDPIFLAALEGNTIYSSPMERDGKVAINLATPVYNAQKVLVGVLVATQDIDTFGEVITKSRNASFIMDKQENYIAHTEKELLESERADLPVYEENKAILEKMLQNDSGNEIWLLETNGEKHYLTYAKIPTTGWIVGVLEAAAVVEDNIVDSFISNTVATIIFLIVVMGIARFFITTRITNHIEGITAHLRVLAEGNFVKPVGEELLNQQGEIGVAARAMDEMRKQTGSVITILKDSIEEMQKNGQELDSISKSTFYALNEISNATQNIAVSVQHEAIDLSEVLENMSTFGKKIENIVKRISIINGEISSTNQSTEKGNKNAIQLGESVEEINASFNQFIEMLKSGENVGSTAVVLTETAEKIAYEIKKFEV